mmetsp:Transcript_19269/g.35355  ORF Transcript_19269/g.35355 Transcript_19269/m.35355 type:complete len:534 (+) Transcript_19269:1676-3277(+)
MVFYARFPFIQGLTDITFVQIFARELLRWLFFRITFGSGAVKLLSGCPTWWNLSALQYHYESQCLPSPLSWYFHNLPADFHRLSVAVMYFILLFLPPLSFLPLRPVQEFVFLGQLGLQVLITISGNYNFFNFLFVAVSFSLLDDSSLHKASWLLKLFGIPVLEDDEVENHSKWWGVPLAAYTCAVFYMWFPPSLVLQGSLPFTLEDLKATLDSGLFYGFISLVPYLALLRAAASIADTSPKYDSWKAVEAESVISKSLSLGVSLVLFGVSALVLLASFQPFLYGLDLSSDKLLLPSESTANSYRLFSRYHLTSSYGLFRRMTGVGGRPELVIQGSLDGRSWRDYQLPYKPQSSDKMPKFNLPHQPRLDWQMWFAALGSINENVWMVNLINRLFYNSPSVMTLFEVNPFAEEPPEHIRMQYYLLNFTTIDSHPWAGETVPFTEAVVNAWYDESPEWWIGKYVVDWLPRLTQSGKKLDKLWKKWQLPDPDEMVKSPPEVHPMHFIPVIEICLGLLAVSAVSGLFKAFYRRGIPDK